MTERDIGQDVPGKIKPVSEKPANIIDPTIKGNISFTDKIIRHPDSTPFDEEDTHFINVFFRAP